MRAGDKQITIKTKLCAYCLIRQKGFCSICRTDDDNRVLLEGKYNPKPQQELPITADNFHLCTRGNFTEIQEIPKGYQQIYESKKSSYYVSPDRQKIVRVSDHWGKHIKHCAWHLKGYNLISCKQWLKLYGREMKIGIIDVKDLEPNYGSIRSSKYSPRVPDCPMCGKSNLIEWGGRQMCRECNHVWERQRIAKTMI